MDNSAATAIKVFFLEANQGPVFAIYYAPDPALACKRNILAVPSFAEEMNRCRSMIAMQARRLARTGVGTLVVDAYGTGDSAGEFAELTWESWRDDLLLGLDWLRAQPGGCDTVWGVRLGALLAADIAAQRAELRNLLLWQPVLNGKTFFNQFLRIRIAADIENPNGIKKTEDLQKVLDSGNLIEVSGYEISRAVARGMEAAVLPSIEKLREKNVAWCEVVAAENQSVGRNNQQFIDSLQAASTRLTTSKVVGELFWQVHERATAPALLDATDQAVASWS